MYYFQAPQIMELPLSHIRTLPLKNLYHPYGVEVSVLRLDELHPLVSGNKWFKLHRYLQRAEQEGKQAVLTFGGAWSNHLLATAAACREAGLKAGAIVRGERPQQLSRTLTDAAALGLRLFFVSRSDYAARIIPPEVLQGFPPTNTLIVPEGGYGPEGCAGAALIARQAATGTYSHVLVACGTGTTLAGLITGFPPETDCSGIAVLRHAGLREETARLLPPELRARLHIKSGFEEGGYARHTPALLRFMNHWYEETGIPSDFVYTGKLFYAADQLIRRGHFASGSRVLLVHTGGLQGNRSLPAGTLMF